MRNRLAVLAQPVEVKLDGLAHLFQGLSFGVAQGHDSGQVGRPSAVSAVAGALDDYCIASHCVLRVIPACLRMLRSVPAGKTLLGLPATVTRPGLSGCLYCRWLRRVAGLSWPARLLGFSYGPNGPWCLHPDYRPAPRPG